MFHQEITKKEDGFLKNKRSAPTMKDVAQEAGVALGTVSKVFNGIPVGESYRIKVEEAAQRLGYQVNNYARGLRSNKTNTVALVLPSIKHPFFAALGDELIGALMKREYRPMFVITNFDYEVEQKCIRMVQQNKVDGVIALTYNPNLAVDADLPFVSIDRYFNSTIPCISSDNYGGGQMAAEKLVELGCKKLLFLRTGSVVPGEPDKRGAGFEAFCQLKNLDYTVVRLNDGDGEEPFYRCLEEHMVDGKLEFDGIFCSTDYVAYHIYCKLQEMGVQVPEDVQIIGFDGITNFGTDKPYCSTIVQPVKELAEAAVNVLLNDDRPTLPALMCLPVRYQPGGTTKD
jgi:LacI family transcriptional regulator